MTNWIDTLQDREGQVQTEHRKKAATLHNYFSKLMGASHTTNAVFDMQRAFQPQPQRTSNLSDPVTIEEIKQVIEQTSNNKAPGPDGFTPEFYKIFKDLLLPDLCTVYNQVIANPHTSLHPLNDSHIILIPKKEGANQPKDFRPINLINSVQKIFSKIMAVRLQKIIQYFVLEEQSGFIKGRHINHGFLYAQEIVTFATRQNQQLGLFKADIHKAFDTLSWDFLQTVLREKGFNENWISLIRRAILEGTTKVLLNSVAGRNIVLRRGVRQGDPMAPYLFILAMDFLPTWMQQLEQRGLFRKPFPLCKQCLLYADDTLFLIQPEPQHIQFLKGILKVFGDLSGLRVSMQKSEFIITCSTPQQIHHKAQLMGCIPSRFPLKYLGMPLSNKKLTKDQYLPLITRMENKLATWKASSLSIGGRVTLINATLTAMPIYMMSTFMLPKWVILKIDRIRRRFL